MNKLACLIFGVMLMSGKSLGYQIESHACSHNSNKCVKITAKRYHTYYAKIYENHDGICSSYGEDGDTIVVAYGGWKGCYAVTWMAVKEMAERDYDPRWTIWSSSIVLQGVNLSTTTISRTMASKCPDCKGTGK